jgi:ribonucleoside-diphosphate reductase alpha chain
MNTINRLEGLSEKIFLDRYAMKSSTANSVTISDTVLVLIKDDPKYPTKQVGEITNREDNNVTVKLRDDTIIETTIDKLTLTIEKTPEELWDRLATAMSSVEATPEKQREWETNFRWLLDDWKLVPGGRIAAGAGVSDELTLFNCYVIPSPHDSRSGIMNTLTQMTEVMARGGGVGINISTLRPRRSIVKGVNGYSSGAVSWGGLYSYVTGLVEQGGSRRGALMLMINDWHPDLLDFITVKQTMDQITNANLSVCVSNGFMKAVKEDLEWELVFPDKSDPEYDKLWDGDLDKWKKLGKKVELYQTLRARDIWDIIIKSAWKSAEPGIVFMEYYNQMSNSWYFNPIICTNPCGEQGLPAWGVCNLSAINLSKFYDEENHDVAWDELGKVVEYSTRFLDNVIDKTPYHFEANEQNQKNERRVGLGTMGLAELLIKLEIRYGSEDCLKFLDKLYSFMARKSYLTSCEIASEKGSFPAFDTEKYLQSGFIKVMTEAYPEIGEAISKSGIRNVTLLTQAPTGSTGTMVGTSTGIEPYFAFEYFRQSRLGFDKQHVPIAQEWKDAHPGEELPEWFVTSMSLSAMDHIHVQAVIQRWVDSSISKTANAPSDFTVEETKELYEKAFELGCKGVTIYRDGSRDIQVLNAVKDEKKEESKSKDIVDDLHSTKASESQINVVDKAYKTRPKILHGTTYKINTPFGMAYITINNLDGFPVEVFLNVGKAGSDVFAMAEALGRVCSLFLRHGDHGNKVQLLIKHLKGIGGSGAVGFGPNRVESISDAVAKALEIHVGLITEKHYVPEIIHTINSVIEQKKNQSTDLCTSCGSASLVNGEGCKTCTNCGYSKCS